MDPREPEVRRVLGRYLTEVIETFNLCPWARAARDKGELEIRVMFGTPTADEVCAVAAEVLAVPTMRVSMIAFPEAPLRSRDLRAFRDEINKRTPAGIADFHPDAGLDLLTPARLVSYLRRSPDPMLQLVPLRVLEAARAAPPPPDRAQQAAMLGGRAAPHKPAIADRIARANHATALAEHAAIAAALDAIALDRRASYAAAGISATTSRSRSSRS
jgi:hypothetical protein